MILKEQMNFIVLFDSSRFSFRYNEVYEDFLENMLPAHLEDIFFLVFVSKYGTYCGSKMEVNSMINFQNNDG